jgi:hypothetical protein
VRGTHLGEGHAPLELVREGLDTGLADAFELLPPLVEEVGFGALALGLPLAHGGGEANGRASSRFW